MNILEDNLKKLKSYMNKKSIPQSEIEDVLNFLLEEKLNAELAINTAEAPINGTFMKQKISQTIRNKAIEIRNLKKDFGDIKAVDGVSFEVKEGEIFGLLGPNGAGKTTIINMMNGLLTPTSGEAIVGGFNVRKNLQKVHELIGVCPQHAALYKFLSGRENIELFGNLHSIEKKALKKRANDLLKEVNFLEAADRKTKGYSGGMIRQINLLIALINNPDIVFLDEPTVGMDPRARRKTWEFIGNIKKQNKTIVLTTHYIEEAEALSDHVAIIDYGKLIAFGSPTELMEKHKAKNLEEVFMKITGRRIMEGV
jgi:ABC-2 type transport system ATP-binding protein